MPISHVGNGGYVSPNNGAATSTITVQIPAGTQVGDLIVITYSQRANHRGSVNASPTMNAGWGIAWENTSTSSSYMMMAIKTATTTEASSAGSTLAIGFLPITSGSSRIAMSFTLSRSVTYRGAKASSSAIQPIGVSGTTSFTSARNIDIGPTSPHGTTDSWAVVGVTASRTSDVGNSPGGFSAVNGDMAGRATSRFTASNGANMSAMFDTNGVVGPEGIGRLASIDGYPTASVFTATGAILILTDADSDHVRSDSDVLALDDSASTWITRGRPQSDVLDLNDSHRAWWDRQLTPTPDVVTLEDTSRQYLDKVLRFSDVVDLSDSHIRPAAYTRIAQDGVDLNDGVSTSHSISRSASDVLNLADESSTVAATFRSFEDVVDLHESPLQRTLGRSVGDTLGLSDDTGSGVDRFLWFSDGIVLTDSHNSDGYTYWDYSVGNLLTLRDDVLVALERPMGLPEDELSLSDEISLHQDFYLDFSSGGMSSSVATFHEADRTVSDGGLSDDYGTEWVGVRDFSRSVGLTEDVETVRDFQRTVQDELELSDDHSTSAEYLRTFDSGSLTDGFGLESTLGFTNRALVDDAWDYVGDFNLDFSEVLDLSDARRVDHVLHVSDTVDLRDDYTNYPTAVLSVEDSAGVVEEWSRESDHVLGLSDDALWEDYAGWDSDNRVTRVDGVGIRDAYDLTHEALRELEDSTGLFDSTVREYHAERTFEDSTLGSVAYVDLYRDLSLEFSDDAGLRDEDLAADQSVSFRVTDHTGLDDSPGLTQGVYLADEMPLSDSLSQTHDRLNEYTDNLGLSDFARPTSGLTETRDVGLSDDFALTRDVVLSFSDVFLTDETSLEDAQDRELELSDSAGLTDEIAKEVTLVFTEDLSLSDESEVGNHVSLEFHDEIDLSDEQEQFREIVAYLSDVVELSDDIASEFTMYFQSWMELESTIMPGVRLRPVDRLQLGDELRTALDKALSRTDVIDLHDSAHVSFVGDYSPVVLDNVGLSDSVSVRSYQFGAVSLKWSLKGPEKKWTYLLDGVKPYED